MASVLVRFAGLDAFVPDTERGPPHGELGEAGDGGGREGVAVLDGEGVAVSGSVAAVDIDLDELTFSLGTVTPANGSAEVAPDGSFTYLPAVDFNGSDEFTVLIDDGFGGTATATVSIQIIAVNDAPSAIFIADDGAEGSVLEFDAPGSSDVDGDALTFGWDFGDGYGATGVTATHVYPDEGTGSYTVTLTVSDGVETTIGLTNVTVFNVAPSVATIEDPPEILEGGSLVLTASFTDPGADTWTGTVDFGDGSPAEALVIDQASKTFELEHTFADDASSP